MKLFAKVFVSIMVGVIIAYVALALDLSDGWVFALYLASALGTAMAVGIFDIEEPKHHRRIIINGNTNANGNYRLSA